jgi:hypothetical protein
MKKKIIVNRHIIRKNKKHGANEPPLSLKTYKSNDKAYELEINDPIGNPVARVIYKPNSPLSCGATVWIETENEVRIVK